MEDALEPGSPTAESLTDPEGGQNEAADSAAKRRKRRIVFFAFGAVLCGGLVLAMVYLGSRIMEPKATAKSVPSTKQSAPQLAPQVAAKAPAEVKRVAAASKPSPVAEKIAKPSAAATSSTVSQPNSVVAPAVLAEAHPGNPYNGPIIEPHAGDLYVQVGAYSPRFTQGFVSDLQQKGLRPVVAPGPSADILRILVGPLPNRDALKDTFAKVEQAGIKDAINRQY